MKQPKQLSPTTSKLISSANNLSYQQRAQLCSNPVAVRLFEIMERKRSNVALAADVTTKAELLALADTLGPLLCIFKTHIDIITDFDWDLIEQLRALARKHDFVLFEDRKFADIGNTVQMQYAQGIYRIAEWADVVNAHTIPGPGIIKGLQEIGASQGRGLVLLAHMSSAGTLATAQYTEQTVAMAHEYPEFVIGFISRGRVTDDPRFLHMTPGVKCEAAGDALGQQYLSPDRAVLECAADVLIVGRGVYQSEDPVAALEMYCEQGWRAYQKRVG